MWTIRGGFDTDLFRGSGDVRDRAARLATRSRDEKKEGASSDVPENRHSVSHKLLDEALILSSRYPPRLGPA